jgi:hypothetical protein
LRTFVPVGEGRRELKLDREYVPLISGWAVRADQPYAVQYPQLLLSEAERDRLALSEDQLRRLQLLLAARDGRVRCVGVVSVDDGPEITRTLLKGLPIEAAVRQAVLESGFVVRLIELESGEIAAELPYRDAYTRERASTFKSGRGRPSKPARIIQVAEEAAVTGQLFVIYAKLEYPDEFLTVSAAALYKRLERARKKQEREQDE